jgi:hypothetical protein
MMGRATRPVVPPNRKIKLDRVYAQPWGPLYPRERKSFGEPLRSEKCQFRKFSQFMCWQQSTCANRTSASLAPCKAHLLRKSLLHE